MNRPGSAPGAAFESGAVDYDARAGFPPGVSDAIARAIVTLAAVEPDDLVVELGAGTGLMGASLARLPLRYLGFDNAPAMLAVFRANAALVAPCLIEADCDAPWPLANASARVVFGSRVIHLLRPEHVAREFCRVARPGGFLLLGRVHRDPASVKERARRQRQELLRTAGIAPRQGEAGSRQVIAACVDAGCREEARVVVTEWTGAIAPATVIDDWETRARMGSVNLDAATHARIIAELRDWARSEFGEPNGPLPFRERYVLDVARLPDTEATRRA